MDFLTRLLTEAYYERRWKWTVNFTGVWANGEARPSNAEARLMGLCSKHAQTRP